MDKAKENYKIGEVRIVSANQIKTQYGRTISCEEKRFFCTNCGEYVTFVNPIKKKPYFRHIKSTEESYECELRIDGQGKLSIYEKVGMSIYLKKNQNKNFSLYIGFYAVNQKDICLLKNESITILPIKSNRKLENKYFIDSINFNSDTTTLKQINFTAPKYKLSYSSSKAKDKLGEIWGTEIEGINESGALFKYGKNGGRKIRINEEISTESDYYCISQDSFIFKGVFGIHYEELGRVSLRNITYRVYKIRIEFNSWNKKALCEFFRDNFKVSLVNKSSEIISIWPPIINHDKTIELFYNKNNLFLLKSTQPNAKAFIHRTGHAKEINLNKIDDKKYTFKVSPISIERAINLNDEYNSEYLLVFNYKERITSFNNEIVIKDINENIIENGIYNELPIDRKLKIYSNSEVEILHYRNNIIFKIYKIKSQINVIEGLKYNDKLVVKIGLKKNILVEYKKLKEKSKKNYFDDGEVYKRLKSLNYIFEPVDTFTRSILRQLKDYPKTYNLVKSYVVKNKMPIGAKKILTKIQFK